MTDIIVYSFGSLGVSDIDPTVGSLTTTFYITLAFYHVIMYCMMTR